MNSEKHERIERRAHAFWEAEGQPHGKHEEHWHLAARQIEAEEGPISEKHKKRRSSGRGGEIPGSKKSKK